MPSTILRAAVFALALLLAHGLRAADPPEWAQHGRPAPVREFLQPTPDPDMPAYCPSGARGRLEGVAPPIVAELTGLWLRAFRAREPGIDVDVPPPYLPPQGELNPRLRAFIDDRLDFAFVTREMAASDVAAFRRHHGFDPLQVPVSGGSYRHFGFVDAVVVIVHQSNPLRAITVEQLDAIFSRTRHRGAPRALVTWDELGVREWGDRKVRVVGTGAWAGEESARATFFRERVMDAAGRRGEWREIVGPPDAGDGIVTETVAVDPLAIGITAAGHLAPGVRPLAIAPGTGAQPIEPSYENVARATYPLSRVFYLVVARKPGQPLSPPLDAFVRFLLSREGQAVVLAHGVFLPLRATQADDARRMLPAVNVAKCSR
jgi:phosphate transport system substrate-binding protein